MADKGPMTEEQAVKALKRLAKRWPKTLWLFSASGTLWVMRTLEDGSPAITSRGTMDQEYIVDDIDIPNDGGDW